MAPTPRPSEAKLEAVYDAIALGMAPYEAMLLSELTDEQIELLDSDPDFNRHVRFKQQLAVHNLLEDVHTAMAFNINKGITTEARWLLSKLDRKHFGNGPLEIGGSDDLPPISFTEKGVE